MSRNRWVKCISTPGNVRGVAIQAHDLVAELAAMHGIRGEGARRLGEAAIGGLLIASYCKPGERVNLNIRGSGQCRQALVDAYPEGRVRGYVIESSESTKNLQGPWGQGILSVLRTKTENTQQPYIGTVPLVTGHLAKDLTFYWAQSEQIPSAVGIAVTLDEKGNIASAGGFLVQALPGARADEVKAIESEIQSLQTLAEDLANDADPLLLLSKIFINTAFVVLEERPLEFRCDCSWQRVERVLTLVGAEELSRLMDQNSPAEVRCDFCSKSYEVGMEDLRRLHSRIVTAESSSSNSSSQQS